MKNVILKAMGVVLVMSAGTAMASGEDMYNNLGCAGCHGVGGNSSVPSMFPTLAGLDAAHIVKQLEDFQSGARVNGTMNAMAPMTEGHEQAIADYLAAQ
jgi:cytochrome c553